MKAPDRITTLATATIATVLLATVGYAVAGPPASGPSDDELPVIGTTALLDAEDASAGIAPLPSAEDTATDEDAEGAEGADGDDHETVAPSIRVEDPDADDDESKDADKKPSNADGDAHDGESSESTKTDEPH